MNWQAMRLSVQKADEAVKNFKTTKEIKPKLKNDTARELRKLLINAWEDTTKAITEDNTSSRFNYRRDLGFGLRLYQIFTTGEYKMPPRIAADCDVWRYITVYIVPDIITERWPKENSWNDRFFRKPNRIYLKVLWWYIYLSWQGSLEQTRRILEPDNEDMIVQLVERSGSHGYRADLYREIMRVYYERRGEITDAQLFRHVMKLHTARVVSVEPELLDGGIITYVRKLYDYFK